MNKRILLEMKVKRRVKEEIAKVNDMLEEKYGPRRTSQTYQEHKAVVIYAWEHGVSVPEAQQMMSKERKTGYIFPKKHGY